MTDLPSSLLVNVREADGTPLQDPAFVRLYLHAGGGQFFQTNTQDSKAVFGGLAGGDYDIEVTCPGHKVAHESTSVYTRGMKYTAYVYLQPESSEGDGQKPPAGIVLAPELKKYLESGIGALRAKRYEIARQYLEKACRVAPRNADAQFLMGEVENLTKHTEAARQRFLAALAINPYDERALLALGLLEFTNDENKEAAVTLEKAVKVNALSWQPQLMLAMTYMRLKYYESARTHAVRLAEVNPDKAAVALLLEGRILLLQGKRDEAGPLFEIVARDFPDDHAAREARLELEELKTSTKEELATASLTLTVPAALPLPTYTLPWAPPDIDSEVPSVATGVSCSVGDVVEKTRTRMLGLLGNFEKFSATERIDHQEVDANGIPGPVKSREFWYLVFIEQPRKNEFYLDEKRNGGDSTDSFPTSLATVGLVSLGMNVFHPVFSSDFNFTCEGLSQWRGEAAWQLRFEQKAEVPSQIRVWTVGAKRYAVPLKGRIWVAANTFDPLHLETELREPIPEIQLRREHLIVDYGPVNFEKAKIKLWLPLDAEMFLEFREKRYHHRHTLRNYQLYSVDTTQQVADPKTN